MEYPGRSVWIVKVWGFGDKPLMRQTFATRFEAERFAAWQISRCEVSKVSGEETQEVKA